MLVVNTRLWWHRTEIPDTRAAAGGLSDSNPSPNPNPSPYPDPGPNPNSHPHLSPSPLQGGLSVSLARDIFLGRAAPDEPNEADGGGGGGDGDGVLVDNFDGLYAAADIAQGAVVLTEAEMPECELPRVAHDPCCAVAVPRHSQTSTRPPLVVPEFGSRTSSGRAWRLW